MPNGTYTLRAWVQNSGGQTTCQLYGRSGTAGQALPLPTVSAWTQVSVPGIVVANGQCEIGLRSVAAVGNYCNLDDVELVSTALASTPAAAPAPPMQLFPNPGAGSVSLAYTLAAPALVRIEPYTLTGQLVRALASQPNQPAGPHTLALPLPAGLAAGTYLVRVADGQRNRQLKLIMP